jgi:hypothetical protein
MHALVGQAAPFDHGREQMQLLAGLEVTTKSVERTAEAIGADIARREQGETQKALQLDLPVIAGQPIPILYVQMDGTGVPVVKKETVGRQGKAVGQPAHTREAKLGCVFTQSTWDKEGYAIRDPDSTTYSGAIETAQEFGKRIFIEAWKRGWSRAQKKVVLGDGAEWIWNLVAEQFPGAIQIVDLYHACQHLWEVVRRLYPNDQGNQKTWMQVHQKLLEKGKIEKLVLSLRSVDADNPEVAGKIRTEADYFERNAGRMCYPKFRRQHLFVASGVIEAGCKTVIGSRLNDLECSGPCGEPTRFSLCAAVISIAALKITGRTDGRPDFHLHVAHTCCVATKTPRMLMSITRSSSSSVVSSNFLGMAVPALFTSTSSRPKVATVFSTAAVTAPASAASA